MVGILRTTTLKTKGGLFCCLLPGKSLLFFVCVLRALLFALPPRLPRLSPSPSILRREQSVAGEGGAGLLASTKTSETVE